MSGLTRTASEPGSAPPRAEAVEAEQDASGEALRGDRNGAGVAPNGPNDPGDFRPPPVLAPVGGQPALSPQPAPSHVDVARIAEQLVQSMQVGGDRHRAGVRMRLQGRGGETVEVQLVADSDGVRATLDGEDPASTQSLALAITREMQARGVTLSELEVT